MATIRPPLYSDPCLTPLFRSIFGVPTPTPTRQPSTRMDVHARGATQIRDPAALETHRNTLRWNRRRSQTQPRTPTEAGTNPYETGVRGGAGREVENWPLGGAGILRSNGDSSQQQLQQPTGHRAVDTPTFLNNTNTKSEAAWPARRVNTSPQAHIIASQGTGVGGHGQTTGTPSPGPYLPPPSTGPLSTGRPPLAGHSLPAIVAERRTLSPRLPRLTSIGQPDLRSLNPPPPQRQHFPGALPQPHPVVLPDTTVHLRPDQQSQPTRGPPMAPQHYVRAGDPGGRPPNGMTPLPSTTRSLSQPGQNQPSPSPPPLPNGTSHGPSGHRVPPQQVQAGYPPQNSYTNGTTPATNGWATGRANDYTSVYHPVGGTRLPLAEGQTALRLSTGNGIEFIVPVDTHQGSRQADEKRQRNAGASARVRKRKKEKELQERLEHQRMKNHVSCDNRDLEGRIQQLAAERDRIEADRERLRNIVLHTPDISELAYQAPQSTGPDPRSGSRGGASPADTLAAAPATRGANGVNGASTNGYGAADPESGEPPSQRRRLTNPHPQVDYFPTRRRLQQQQLLLRHNHGRRRTRRYTARRRSGTKPDGRPNTILDGCRGGQALLRVYVGLLRRRETGNSRDNYFHE
ncbi:hypothetical protein F5Y17DRAFT_463733 [Xylariaceae sp. FL0594]|nr:hypothetical protein F5Y17DRAFT_463733 [Xylariaceae sp. FL0594]